MKVWDWSCEQNDRSFHQITWYIEFWAFKFKRNPFLKHCLGLKTQCTTESVEMAYYSNPLTNLEPLNLPFKQKIKNFYSKRLVRKWTMISSWNLNYKTGYISHTVQQLTYNTYIMYHYSRFGICLSVNRQIMNFGFWSIIDH